MASQLDYFRAAVGEAGGNGDDAPGRVTVARAMYTASNFEQVVADARVPFMWFKETGNEVGAPPERRGELLPDNFAEYRRRFSAESSVDFKQMAEEVILFGDPDEVSEKVEVLRQSGVEKVILFVNYGGIEHRKVLDSLELFAKEVMPAFAD